VSLTTEHPRILYFFRTNNIAKINKI